MNGTESHGVASIVALYESIRADTRHFVVQICAYAALIVTAVGVLSGIVLREGLRGLTQRTDEALLAYQMGRSPLIWFALAGMALMFSVLSVAIVGVVGAIRQRQLEARQCRQALASYDVPVDLVFEVARNRLEPATTWVLAAPAAFMLIILLVMLINLSPPEQNGWALSVLLGSLLITGFFGERLLPPRWPAANEALPVLGRHLILVIWLAGLAFYSSELALGAPISIPQITRIYSAALFACGLMMFCWYRIAQEQYRSGCLLDKISEADQYSGADTRDESTPNVDPVRVARGFMLASASLVAIAGGRFVAAIFCH